LSTLSEASEAEALAALLLGQTVTWKCARKYEEKRYPTKSGKVVGYRGDKILIEYLAIPSLNKRKTIAIEPGLLDEVRNSGFTGV